MKRKGKAWEACVQSHAFMAREITHGIAVQDNALSALQKKAYYIILCISYYIYIYEPAESSTDVHQSCAMQSKPHRRHSHRE